MAYIGHLAVAAAFTADVTRPEAVACSGPYRVLP
jgi:hypothetical protein